MAASSKRTPSSRPTSDELLDFLLEHVPDVIFFKDRFGQFIRVNHAFLELFGLKEQNDVIGKSDADFLEPDDAERTLKDEAKVMESGESIVGAIHCKRREDGTLWWSLTTKLPLKNAKGAIVGTCGISRDITDLKNAESDLSQANIELEQALESLQEMQAQLIEAEKVQSIARLAEGLAHEIRNPLAVISMGMDYLSQDPNIRADDACQAVFEDMQEALRRSDRVIETLLQAARPVGLDLVPVDVNDILQQVYASMSLDVESSGTQVNWELSTQEPVVSGDQKQLSNVLEGLMMNALEAMPAGGELTFRTRIEDSRSTQIQRDAGSRCGQLFHGVDHVICIEIEDTGSGISKESMSRVFDAFFTTKETGPQQGLGLGLTASRAIIELHRGLLTLENRAQSNGAIATIRLAEQNAKST